MSDCHDWRQSSNGIRFSISDLSPPNARLLPCKYSERAGISLYDALHTPGAEPFKFSDATIKEVSETLLQFKKICDGYEIRKENILVFATEAMRTATNKDAMLNSIKNTSGLTVDILSPPMESLFGAMGARSGFEHVDGLFMDLGGGSVQMAYMSTEGSLEKYPAVVGEAARSMPFGAARLTDAIKSSSTTTATKAGLHKQMKENFGKLQHDGSWSKCPQFGRKLTTCFKALHMSCYRHRFLFSWCRG